MKHFTEHEIIILSEKNPKKLDQVEKHLFGPALKRFQEMRRKFRKTNYGKMKLDGPDKILSGDISMEHAKVDHKDLKVVMTVDPAIKQKKPSKKKKTAKKRKTN